MLILKPFIFIKMIWLSIFWSTPLMIPRSNNILFSLLKLQGLNNCSGNEELISEHWNLLHADILLNTLLFNIYEGNFIAKKLHQRNFSKSLTVQLTVIVTVFKTAHLLVWKYLLCRWAYHVVVINPT